MIINVVFLICGILFVSSSDRQKNQQSSSMLWDLILAEGRTGKIVGAISGLFPKSAKFYNGNIGITLDKDLLTSPNVNVVKEIKVFEGKGVEIKHTKYPIALDLAPPNNKENICGLILGSSYANNAIKKVQILWKPKPQASWDLLAVPNTGKYLFDFTENAMRDKHTVLFDPVPASNLRLLIHANDNAGLNLTAALIYGCQYKGIINLSCNEIFEQNEKFKYMKQGIPISISCPTNCIKTKSCIGYKVYSSDSPICSVAEQALSKNGDRRIFLYKIPKVAIFRHQVNPVLNNGIYCKRSSIPHEGITFTRVYYDFSMKEYQKITG